MSPIRILIAEDHAMLADALQMLLSSQPDMHCVGVAPSGHEALELAAGLQPDILLLDLGMPGLDGLGVMRELQAAKSATRTLVVTARMDSGSVRAALALGAAGYLPKNESGSELLLAIRRVAQGRRYISADIASLFVDDAESQNTEHKLGIRNSAEMAAYAIRTQSGTTTPGEL